MNANTSLKLFMLRYGKRGSAVRNDQNEPLYFSDKMKAKKHRDAMNADNEHNSVVVSLGPDHRNFNQTNGGNR